MFKLISKIGFILYLRSFVNLNSRRIKLLFICLCIFLFINYFYIDLQGLLREINPSYLIYALVFKYSVLIPTFITAFFNFINLCFTEETLGKDRLLNKALEDLERSEDSIKKKEDTFKKFEDISKYPKLKSKSDRLYE